MIRVRSALVAVCLCLLLAACADDGRTLRPPATGATAPPPPTVVVSSSGQTVGQAPGAAGVLELTSPAFAPDTAIPIVHTCDGNNVSPPLAWGAAPTGTVELVITVIDPDANGFVHWVMAGIDPSVQAIGEGSVPDGAVQAMNNGNTLGYTGPCPPKGTPHHYVFTIYALNGPSGVTQGMDGRNAVATISQLKATTATLIGTYQRAG
jgi:Raf kinase inhibitor-like YbhB/YbcL family protein